jgi:hypothetical protein
MARIEIKGLLELCQSFVVSSGEIENNSDIDSYPRREWIQLVRQLDLLDRFFVPALLR